MVDFLCEMTDLEHLIVILCVCEYDDSAYTKPVLIPLLELKELKRFRLSSDVGVSMVTRILDLRDEYGRHCYSE